MYEPNKGKGKGSIAPIDTTKACGDSISTAALILNPTLDGGDERSTPCPVAVSPGQNPVLVGQGAGWAQSPSTRRFVSAKYESR
jgi:hypothetical protein